MKTITVSFAGTIYIKNLKSGEKVHIDNDITISAFLLKNGLNACHLKLIIPVVNSVEQKLDYTLQDGDKLNLYLPIGGG